MTKLAKNILLSAFLIALIVIGIYSINSISKKNNAVVLTTESPNNTGNHSPSPSSPILTPQQSTQASNAPTSLKPPINTATPIPRTLFWKEEVVQGSEIQQKSSLPPSIILEEGKVICFNENIEKQRYYIYADDKLLFDTGLSINDDTFYTCSLSRDDEKNTYLFFADKENNLYMNKYDSSGVITINKQFIDCYKTLRIERMEYYNGLIYVQYRSDEKNQPFIDEFNILSGVNRKDFINFDKLKIGRLYGFEIDKKGFLYFLMGPKQGLVYVALFSPNELNPNTTYMPNILPGPGERDIKIVGDYLYYLDTSGIYRCNKEKGTGIKKLVSFGEDTSFLLTDTPTGTFYHEGFDVNENETIVMGFYQYNENGRYSRSIYRLTEQDQQFVPEKKYDYELVITCGYIQPVIKEAVLRYQLQNPNVKITFDNLYETQEQYIANWESAASILTTKLLTNDVGDIFALGGMKLDPYNLLRTDVFLDLNEYMQKDKIYDCVNNADLNAITIDGKISALPVAVLGQYYVYNETLGSKLGLGITQDNLDHFKWSDAITLSKELIDRKADISVFNNSSKYVLLELLVSNIPDLVDIEAKTYDLRQEWFLQLMRELKDVYNSPTFAEESKPNEIFHLTGEKSLFKSREFGSNYYFAKYHKTSHIDKFMYFIGFSGEENRNEVEYSQYLYSISNNSIQKDKAWEFLKFLIGSQFQQNIGLDAPVNTEVHKMSIIESGFSETDKQDVNKIRTNVDYLYELSYIKMDVFQPLEKYLNGELTLEQAIYQAEYNLLLRLNE